MNDKSQSSPTSVMEPTKPLVQPVISKQSSLLSILVVLVVILLGSTGYLAYQNMQLQKQLLKPKISLPISSTSPTTQITEANQIPGWQNYSDNGVNIEYPKGWIVKNNPYTPYDIYFYDPSTGAPLGNGGSTVYKDSLDMTLIPISQTINEYVNNLQAQQGPELSKDFQTKTISLNGQQVVAYHMGGEGTVGWYIPFTNGKVIANLGALTTDPSNPNIELQMISTFQFSNQPSNDINKVFVKKAVDDFYRALTAKDGKKLFSYMTPPSTPDEQSNYNWLTGADLGSNAFYRVFLRINLGVSQIQDVQKIDDGTYKVTLKDSIQVYSNAGATAGTYSEPKTRDTITMTVVNSNGQWLIDKYTDTSNTTNGGNAGTPKYNGFGQ